MTLCILSVIIYTTQLWVFSFQLFEAGKVEEAALLAAHSPKVININTFIIVT